MKVLIDPFASDDARLLVGQKSASLLQSSKAVLTETFQNDRSVTRLRGIAKPAQEDGSRNCQQYQSS
jgi:hypothetical protein